PLLTPTLATLFKARFLAAPATSSPATALGGSSQAGSASKSTISTPFLLGFGAGGALLPAVTFLPLAARVGARFPALCGAGDAGFTGCSPGCASSSFLDLRRA